ncbi:RND transporter, partial [Acinetobacter sp. ULE_I053]
MKKIAFAIAATSIVGFSSASQAATDVCVFDLLGKSGESFQMAQEWALSAKSWGADITLIPKQDEAVADHDFNA